MYCQKCGNQIESNQNFCPFCGEPISSQGKDFEPINHAAPQAEHEEPTRQERKLNVGMLVWSILNLLACCLPLGIASLILTILAQSAESDADEASKLKGAKICNLIATIVGAVIVIGYFLLVFFALMTMGMSGLDPEFWVELD